MVDASDLLLTVAPSVVTGLSAYWLYRAGENNGRRQLEAESSRMDRELRREAQRLDNEKAEAALVGRRSRYELFLEAVQETSAFLQQSAAAATTYAGQKALGDGSGTPAADDPPRPVPDEMLQRLAAGAAGASLEAPDELAALIFKLQDYLVVEVRDLAKGWGNHEGRGVLDSALVGEIRQMMRADLDR